MSHYAQPRELRCGYRARAYRLPGPYPYYEEMISHILDVWSFRPVIS